jgi:hypothetical protein
MCPADFFCTKFLLLAAGDFLAEENLLFVYAGFFIKLVSKLNLSPNLVR